jgi:putative ABC transport system permease protein
VVTPVSNSTWSLAIAVKDAPPMADRDRNVLVNMVTPGWFETYGTRLIAGRDVDSRDSSAAPHVVLVNEAFAKRFFPGTNAIGHVVEFARGTTQSAPPCTVVGIVEDAVYRNLREPIRPTMYEPLAQYDASRFPLVSASISVRSSADNPAPLSHSIASALTAVDRDVAFSFRPLADQVNASLIQERIVATLAGFFGVLALLLAALGLYGVTAYAVTRRRTEIGIRMALGASPGGVVRLVLSRVTVLVVAGIAIGAAVSVWASQFVTALLYGLPPRDPVTLGGAVVTLTIVGAIAGWLPAFRASRIDPAQVLRDA